MTILAKRLRAARQALVPEVSLRELAKRFDISPSTVSLWESGKTAPSCDTLIKLSGMYGVSSDWLLGLDASELPSRSSPGRRYMALSVPIVPASDIARQSWDAAAELLQTMIEYPPKTAAALQVSNDAVASVCPVGCYVVVSRTHAVEPGCIVLAAPGNGSAPILRRYLREGGAELLVADDARYPTYRVDDGTEIIGRVTEVTARKLV